MELKDLEPGALEKHLDSIGAPGSLPRLCEIARLELGRRSEAAKKVITARLERVKEQNEIDKLI